MKQQDKITEHGYCGKLNNKEIQNREERDSWVNGKSGMKTGVGICGITW